MKSCPPSGPQVVVEPNSHGSWVEEVDMAKDCVMVLVVMGACFLWSVRSLCMKGCVAVTAIASPYRSADFLEEVVRGGLAKGDVDYRDVTVHWDRVFHFLTKK